MRIIAALCIWATALALAHGFAGEAPREEPQQSPAQRLAEADRQYRGVLQDILEAAKLADDKATIGDIEPRLAATERRAGGKKEEPRKLVITGTMLLGKSSVELLVSSDGLAWRDLVHYADIVDVTVNAVN